MHTYVYYYNVYNDEWIGIQYHLYDHNELVRDLLSCMVSGGVHSFNLNFELCWKSKIYFINIKLLESLVQKGFNKI